MHASTTEIDWMEKKKMVVGEYVYLVNGQLENMFTLLSNLCMFMSGQRLCLSVVFPPAVV